MPSTPRMPHPIASWLVAAAAGTLLLLLSDLVMPPAGLPFPGHGERFQAMTLDPLALRGEFPQRILWPLLAWLAGLGGERAPLFAQAVNAAFLAVVYWFARQRLPSGIDALLVAAGTAASGAVLVYKPMACLSDPLLFLLLLLAVHHVRRPVPFWGLVLLAGLAHEMAFLLAPWLVWLRCRTGSPLGRELLWLAGSAALFAGWLGLVRTWGTGASYGIAYYLEHNFWVPWGLPGMWALLGLEVLVEFGPLLVVVVWAWRADRLAMGRWGPWLLAGCLLLLPLVAYDVMRFAAFGFVPLVLGSIALLRERRGRPVVAVLLVAAVGCYRWTHPNPTEEGGRAFRHLSGQILGRFRSDLEQGVRPLATPGNAAGYYRDLVAANLGLVLGAVVAAGAIAAAAAWLGRHLRAAPDVPA
ncbi:MAG: hypothetical protein KF830_01535 [Planctomycetes bacterium]|nr:hypothetical protein [Planctomycetota bacterium]